MVIKLFITWKTPYNYERTLKMLPPSNVIGSHVFKIWTIPSEKKSLKCDRVITPTVKSQKVLLTYFTVLINLFKITMMISSHFIYILMRTKYAFFLFAAKMISTAFGLRALRLKLHSLFLQNVSNSEYRLWLNPQYLTQVQITRCIFFFSKNLGIMPLT